MIHVGCTHASVTPSASSTGSEREVLELRYGLDRDGDPRTLQEVGEMLGLSRERIRQIESRAKEKVRKSKRAGELRSYLNLRTELQSRPPAHALRTLRRYRMETRRADGARRVVRCDCWREGLTTRLLDEARIPPRYRRCDLETFVTYPNEKLLGAVKQARRFAEQFPEPRKSLCLIGPPGIGKTHLAVAVLRSVILDKGARGLFYDSAICCA